MPNLSTSILAPPKELTASTQNITSGYFFITSAISLTGFIIPLEVSLWVTVIRSYLPVAKTWSTDSAVLGNPHSTSNLSAGTLLSSAIANQRLPKLPQENTAALF